MRVFVDALARMPTVSIGTQALILGTLQIIRSRYPDAEFVMLSGNLKMERSYLASAGFSVELIERCGSQVGTFAQIRRILSGVDAVVCAWGDAYVTFPPHFMLRKILSLRRAGVPLVLFTASLGPFLRPVDRILARTALRRFDRLTVRDLNTQRYLMGLGLSNVRAVADTAFVLEPSPRRAVSRILRAEGIPACQSSIGVNVSILLHHLFRKRGLPPYPGLMIALVRHLRQATGAKILLIPHQIYPAAHPGSDGVRSSRDGDDRIAIEMILAGLGQSDGVYAIRGDYSPGDYKGIISSCDMFVGGRMHSVIAAVSTAVPSVIIQYSHKAGGVMEMLGLDQHIWDIGSSQSELLQKASDVWEGRDAIRRQLSLRMPSVIREAYSVGDVLTEALEGARC